MKVAIVSMNSSGDKRPGDIVVAAARGCVNKESARELLSENMKGLRKTLEQSIGKGHYAVLDQACLQIQFEEVSRIATMALCESPYLSHLQQSMRFVELSEDGGYFVPTEIRNSRYNQLFKDRVKLSFDWYKEFIEQKIPVEDARSILPVCTNTNIISIGSLRAWYQIIQNFKKIGMPEELGLIANQLEEKIQENLPLLSGWDVDVKALKPYPSIFWGTENNFPITSSELIQHKGGYSYFNINSQDIENALKGDQESLAKLRRVREIYAVHGSLAMWHQMIRHRTLDAEVESIYNGIGSFIGSASIVKKELHSDFDKNIDGQFKLYETMITNGIRKEDAVYLFPNATSLYGIIQVDGWNALCGFLPERLCTHAQREIRAISSKIRDDFNTRHEEFRGHIKPKCHRAGRCTEDDKDCKIYPTLTR